MVRGTRSGSTRVIIAIVFFIGTTTLTPSAGPDGSKIAFEGDRFGGWGLGAMQPDGSGIVNLNSPPGAADASWSPNGQQVAFEADPNGDGDLEIFIMNADGSNVRQLTNSPGWDFWPDWFPNGRQIAFTSLRTGVPNIYVMNVDGSEQHALTNDPVLGCFEPDVSPNGKDVLAMCSPEFAPPTIWKISAGDGAMTALTQPGPYEDHDAQWSPDGKRIVFSSSRNGPPRVWVMDADGSNMTQLTFGPGLDFDPTFSPNGQQIAWWKLRFGQGDVWVMNADGSGQVNVTNTPATFEGFPDWHQGHLGTR